MEQQRGWSESPKKERSDRRAWTGCQVLFSFWLPKYGPRQGWRGQNWPCIGNHFTIMIPKYPSKVRILLQSNIPGIIHANIRFLLSPNPIAMAAPIGAPVIRGANMDRPIIPNLSQDRITNDLPFPSPFTGCFLMSLSRIFVPMYNTINTPLMEPIVVMAIINIG